MASQPASNVVIESALATLQPIRDLSRNWDVDIASCLEEYLHELIGDSYDALSHNEDSHPQENLSDTVPNFAQAALILHNSSHVYSRKVEYLHGLVYKALYDFFKVHSSNAKESKRKSGDASIDEFYDFDPHENFLLLDDVVPEDWNRQRINLKEEDDAENRLTTSSTPMNHSITRSRLSLGGLSVTRVDSSNLDFATSSQQRTMLGALSTGSLRLIDGHCDVGENGLLLMPGSQSSVPIETFLNDEPASGRRSLFQGDEVEFQISQAANNDFDDHSNDGPGFNMGDNDDHSIPQNIEDGDFPVEIGVQQQQREKRVTFAETSTRQQQADPWALLDPHSNQGVSQRPLRKGKTYKLPEGLVQPPSECVTGAGTNPPRQSRPRSSKAKDRPVYSVETLEVYLGSRQNMPNIPLSGLAYGDEFSYIAKFNAKKRAAKRQLERKQAIESAVMPTSAGYDDWDDDNEDNGPGYDWVGENFDEDNDVIGNAGVSSLDEAFQNVVDGTGESNFGKSFEELCRAHIQAFAKGAEEFAMNTQLSRRVSKWQAKLAPILEEEERRAEFDIHKYSERLIASAQKGLLNVKRKSDGTQLASTRKVEFSSVTKDCSQSDVCRLFLASLNLANAGNLHIDEMASHFQFDLVSDIVQRPMQTYMAPSLVEDV